MNGRDGPCNRPIRQTACAEHFDTTMSCVEAAQAHHPWLFAFVSSWLRKPVRHPTQTPDLTGRNRDKYSKKDNLIDKGGLCRPVHGNSDST